MVKAQKRDYRVTQIMSRQDLADWFGQHGHPRVRVRMSLQRPNVGYAYLPYHLKKWDASFLLQMVNDATHVGEVHIVSGWWSWFWRGVLGLGH